MKHQQGSALIFSLVILLVMTLIGITSMSTSTLEEKMAANDRAQKTAFQNAETGMLGAETTLNAQTYYGELYEDFTAGNLGYYDMGAPVFDIYDPEQWAGNCIQDNVIADQDNPPCYIVENLALIPPENPFEPGAVTRLITRVTVRGTDDSNTASVLLQTYNEKQIVSN
ncbi:MAG TPA: hypothetical protein ENK35_06490 [Candidatus Tenderia sp.]|nr:hypothetical protein [Candidatus Tenderia sp.]